MMTTKLNLSLKRLIFISLIFILFLQKQFSESSESQWIVGAEKFKYISSISDQTVADGIEEMFSQRILEKLGRSLVHIVYPDEKYEQSIYDLRKKRLSLYLQLSSETKKRDAIMLQNYSKGKMKHKIKLQEKSITDVKEKIIENLKEARKAEEKFEKENKLGGEGKYYDNNMNDGESFGLMLKNMFSKDAEIITSNKIGFYKDSPMAFFVPSEEAKKAGYESFAFENEVVNANIKTLLTGTISSYDNYFYVSVSVYEYPGGKLRKTVSEVGEIDDADFISTSIAHQLLNVVTNEVPVNLNVSIYPESFEAETRFFIDGVLQPENFHELSTYSGIHTFQFINDTCEPEEFTYFFEGNQNYKIEVTMTEKKDTFLRIFNASSYAGTIFANSIEGVTEENEIGIYSKIKINGKNIIGQFVTEDGFSSMYTIPDKLIFEDNNIKIKPKNFDSNKYIDTRRRLMYGSYTLLIFSLIPYFYTYGNYYTYANKYNNNLGTYDEVLTWKTRNQICGGISLTCGAIFIYELVRYLVAANSVLPYEAKQIKPKKGVYKKIQNYPEKEKKDKKKKAKTDSDITEASDFVYDENQAVKENKTENKSENEIDEAIDIEEIE